MQPLLDSQSAKIYKFKTLKVGADFGEPGTGKTRSTLELIKSTPTDCVVWFTPFQTKANLKAEIDKWGGIGDRNLIIVGTETISSSDRTYLKLTETIQNSTAFIVVDESLKIKNWDAKRTKRLIELGKLCEYKMILNGTPISRNILDIWAQMEFLSPKILKMDMAEYKNTFCEYTTIKKRFGNSWRTKEFITKYHNVDYLYSIIAPYVYECDLELEIGKQYIDLSYNLSTEDAEEYKKLKEKYLDDETLQWKNNNIFLELTQKMQHLYCNTEEKFDVLGTFLKDADRSKVIIYRKFIDSETELKKRFPDIKICSIQSHAYGLNLQDYDTIIGWDKVWDYALVKQRDHRIFRTGQKNDCRFVSMTGNVNLESLMDSNIDKKGKLLSYFKSHGFKKLAEKL
jgi:SNF2 family DNA or RNA helicase